MAEFDPFGKLDDILYAPVELINDYLREPLRKKQQKRDNEIKQAAADIRIKENQQAAQIEMDKAAHEAKLNQDRINQASENRRKDAELKAKIERERTKEEANIRIQQMQEQARLDMEKRKNDERLQMEMKKFDIEMEAIIAKQEEEQRDRLVESIKRYQLDLANAMKDIVDSIGTMSLDLHQKAYNLVEEKTKEYKKIQDETKEKSVLELKQVKEEFMDSDLETYRILVNTIMDERRKMIDAADRFILGLSEDIKRINETTTVIITTGMDNINQNIASMTTSLPGNMLDTVCLTDKKKSDIIDIS